MPLDKEDDEHLRILSVSYYVNAGLALGFCALGLVYIALELNFRANPPQSSDAQVIAEFTGRILPTGSVQAVAIATALFGVFGICSVLTGRFLASRRRWLYCLITAAITLLYVPIGTMIGWFTIAVLQRPGVKEAFR